MRVALLASGSPDEGGERIRTEGGAEDDNTKTKAEHMHTEGGANTQTDNELGHEHYMVNDHYWDIIENMHGPHSHEAFGLENQLNTRLSDHGSLERPFDQTFIPDADENIFMNMIFSKAQHYLNEAAIVHERHPTIGITAIVPKWASIDTFGWTESKLIKVNTHFFQHPDGKDAGPLKWEV